MSQLRKVTVDKGALAIMPAYLLEGVRDIDLDEEAVLIVVDRPVPTTDLAVVLQAAGVDGESPGGVA